MSRSGNGKLNLAELREAIAGVDAKLAEIEAEVIEAKHTKRRTAQSSPVDWHKADGRERESKAECERLNDVRVELEADLVEAELVEETKRRKGLAEEVMAIARDMRQSQLPVHLVAVITEIEELIEDLARVRLICGAGPGGEGAVVNARNLLLTAFARLPWTRFGAPDRRWAASELIQSWAAACEGGAKRFAAENPKSASSRSAAWGKPVANAVATGKPNGGIDPAKPIRGDDPTFRVYNDAADAAKAKYAAMKGK